MSIYFSKYAEKKFTILNKHCFYPLREEVEDCLLTPDKISKKGKYLAAKKDKFKVVYAKIDKIKKVITFYPLK